jgi:hypothetical protein
MRAETDSVSEKLGSFLMLDNGQVHKLIIPKTEVHILQNSSYDRGVIGI